MATGVLYVGTSGFAYPAWSPRFYPPATRPGAFLGHYAAALRACELNGTYYRQPSEAAVRVWSTATPATFRFAVKAHRNGAARAFLHDPVGTLGWLTIPYRRFEERLGAVLVRVPDEVGRDDARLDNFLAAWPSELPLALELRHPSWHVDETFARLRAAGAALCASENDADTEPPVLRLTGSFLYLRLRRSAYAPADLEAWAARLEPFLSAGHDAFVFFRHDEIGLAPERARALDAMVAASLT